NGIMDHPGYALSGNEDSSAGWPLWITGFSAANHSSLLFSLQDQFFKFFVTGNAQFDSLTFTPADYAPRLQELSALLDATDADLPAFTGRGGKVILWHSWADSAISAKQTEAYYNRVVAAAGGQENADGFARFYTSAAVEHVGGGNGAPLF